MFIPETGHASMLPVKVVGNGELAVASCICAEPVHPTVSQAEPQASFVPVSDQKPVKAESSYGQILKSSAWIGGSQAANIALGIVRTKAMAILLGPAGF